MNHPLENSYFPFTRRIPGENNLFYCTVCRHNKDVSLWKFGGMTTHTCTPKHNYHVAHPSTDNYRNVAVMEPELYKDYLRLNK